MDKKHKFFIVEDHRLFREGLKSMLNSRDDIDIVGEAEDGLQAVRRIRRTTPDLVLLDLSNAQDGRNFGDERGLNGNCRKRGSLR